MSTPAVKTAEMLLAELLREWQKVRMDDLGNPVQESKIALNCELFNGFLHEAQFEDEETTELAVAYESKVRATMCQIRKRQWLRSCRFSVVMGRSGDYTDALRRQYQDIREMLGAMVIRLTPELEVLYASRN